MKCNNQSNPQCRTVTVNQKITEDTDFTLNNTVTKKKIVIFFISKLN